MLKLTETYADKRLALNPFRAWQHYKIELVDTDRDTYTVEKLINDILDQLCYNFFLISVDAPSTLYADTEQTQTLVYDMIFVNGRLIDNHKDVFYEVKDRVIKKLHMYKSEQETIVFDVGVNWEEVG